MRFFDQAMVIYVKNNCTHKTISVSLRKVTLFNGPMKKHAAVNFYCVPLPKIIQFLIQTKASKHLGIWGYTWLIVICNVAFIMKVLKYFLTFRLYIKRQ